jgi:hypothetical protein
MKQVWASLLSAGNKVKRVVPEILIMACLQRCMQEFKINLSGIVRQPRASNRYKRNRNKGREVKLIGETW